MSIKSVNSYFDLKKFLDGKTLQVTGCKLHYLYKDGKKTDSTDGTALDVIILKDKDKLNRYSTFKVVILGKKLSLDVDAQDVILKFKSFDDVQASIYGDFHNQLSVKTPPTNVSLQTVGD